VLEIKPVFPPVAHGSCARLAVIYLGYLTALWLWRRRGVASGGPMG
jgi:hypothetical protein